MSTEEPSPEVLAQVREALAAPMSFTRAELAEKASIPALAQWPAPAKRGRGRPAHLKPLPRLLQAIPGWFLKWELLPKNRAEIASGRRIKAALNAYGVRAAASKLGKLGGEPTSQQVADYLGEANSPDLSTVRKILRGIKGE